MNRTGIVRPYGDTLDDGQIQFSFTLPTPFGRRAEEAAKQLLLEMGITDIRLAAARNLGNGFTFFVAYGRTDKEVKLDTIELDDSLDAPPLDMHEIEELLAKEFKHPIIIVGACIGTDAHTVGIDAIMNMKGFAGDYGLERYHMFETHNLGAQVPPAELVRRAIELKASVILVSQVVTQKQIHLKHLTQLVDILEAEGVRDDVLLIVGGPYIDNKLAKELGYEAGFGAGSRPSQVAAFIARQLIARKATKIGN